MAGCDSGYFCHVCGRYVENIEDSELYLQFILGEVEFDDLSHLPEAHIRCSPSLAQYIVHADFEPVIATDEASAKANLAPALVAEQEALVTRAWMRLQMLLPCRVPLSHYPLDCEDEAPIEYRTRSRDEHTHPRCAD